tara:strand:+ start:929 stop:1225 length:297 start_codon:yes stop_codon:yes gene_type:complete
MKNKVNYLKKIGSIFVLILIASCSSEECADCHVVIDVNGIEYEIMELGEYCEDALHDIEEEVYTLQDTFLTDADGNILPSTVFPGDTVEVHCGEAHDH